MYALILTTATPTGVEVRVCCGLYPFSTSRYYPHSSERLHWQLEHQPHFAETALRNVGKCTILTSSNEKIFRITGHLCGEFQHKGQWRGALMFSLICAAIDGWANHREAGYLRCHRAHYDVIVMLYAPSIFKNWSYNNYKTKHSKLYLYFTEYIEYDFE